MSREDKIYDFLRKTLFIEVVILVLIVSGCYPPAATMQDARMVGKNNARLTGYWYGLEDAGDGGEKVANVYGGLLGIGSSDRTEVQFRLDHFSFVGAGDDEDSGYEFVSIAPKFGLSEDRLALLVPIGMYIENGISFETTQIHPTLLASQPVGRGFEVNAAAKVIFPFDQDYYTWFDVGVGVGVSSDLDRWMLLPEVSYTICLDEDEVDPVWTYGIALVYLAHP
jgi:hypothetical protein